MIFNLKIPPLFKRHKHKQENVIYLDSPVKSEKELYAKRKYHTWNGIEIALIVNKVKTAIKSNTNVNLSELKEFMPYRSISSLRNKVRWIVNGTTRKKIGTYTEKKDKKEIKK